MKTKSIMVLLAGIFGIATLFLSSCEKDEDRNPPHITLSVGENYIADGSIVEIGKPLRFGIEATGIDANITNFTVKILAAGEYRTVLDSGLNAASFRADEVFYQGVEDTAEWVFSVMDKNRLITSSSLMIYKDPNSTFGGIVHYPSIKIGMDQSTTTGHYFSTTTGNVWMNDTAQMNQSLIDVLAYFKYSEDNGVLKPSPTFSSAGESDEGAFEYYPELSQWSTLNYTKYDIRADNGVTEDAFEQAHNDSLLIVSYDDVWGKRKYKWVSAGNIIPFITSAGKKGIIRVIEADTVANGNIEFEMKIQQ